MESTQHNQPSISTNQPSTSTNKIMVLDGCFRSQITLLGQKIYNRPTNRLRVNLNNPNIAQGVHMDFLNAGANVIRTNTYRASENYLRRHLHYSEKTIKNFFVKSVENAREAVKDYTSTNKKDPKNYMVVGSCGSFTDCSKYPESCLNRDVYKEYHKLRAKSLIDAKVDMLAFESIPCAEEAYAVVELMNELQYSQVWISFRCYDDESDKKLFCGNILSDVARNCYDYSRQKICAVGINCINPANVLSALSSINDRNKGQTIIPLVACSNSGSRNKPSPYWKSMFCVSEYPVQEWLNMNIRYIGGCCHVLPNNIKSIRDEVDKYYTTSQIQS